MTKKHDQSISQDDDQDIKDLEDMLEKVKSDKDEENIDDIEEENTFVISISKDNDYYST